MIRCSKRSTFQCPKWSLNRFASHFYLFFFYQAGSATGYFVTNTCKINIMCFGMFVEKRSVLAYGLQSRIVWNFISALKHTLALVTGKIKNRLLEMCASNVLNNCGIESAVLLHFSPCFAGTCLALGNPRGLNVTSLDMRLFAFFFPPIWVSFAHSLRWFFYAFVPSKHVHPWWFAYL